MKQVVCSTPKLRTPGLGMALNWCPGCHNGIIHRIVMEVIEELDIAGRAIGLIGIGCCCTIVRGMDIDSIFALHGRCLPVGAAVKRGLPDAVVFDIEGDGGLGAIGLGHFVSSCNRGDKITTLFVNNGSYGRTGGQMAPTTLSGVRTTTSPYGRDPVVSGFPFHAAELAAIMEGTAYSARVSVHTPANRQRAKKAVKTAFQKQLDGVGFSLVEILCACPANWELTPVESLKFIEEKMIPIFPLGEFKNIDSIDYSLDEELTRLGRG